MKKIIVILLAVILGKFMFSQTICFNQTTNFDGVFIAITSIIENDTDYTIAGSRSGGKVGVIKIDKYSNFLWINLFTNEAALLHSLEYVPNNYKKTSTNNFIAAGTAQNGIATINKTFILKTDSLNNKIYMNYILEEDSCDGCTHFNYIFENNSGLYVIMGQDSRDSSGLFLPNKEGDGILLITDTGSNILNHKNYGGPLNYPDWFNTGLQLGNYYYLFGATRSYAPGYVTGFDRTDGWVVKTDLQGNEVASAAFGNPVFWDGEFTSCLKLPNNKILTTTSIATYKNIQGFIHAKPLILLLNEDISINKEVYFNESYEIGDTLFGRGMISFTTHDSLSFAFLGLNIKYNMTSYQMLRRNATITKLDNNYKVLYHRNYIHTGSIYNNLNPQVITTTSDGGYIFGGYVVDATLSPSQQAWLVKTDSLGCDGFTSCNDTAMVVEVLSYPDTLCKNDTNLIHVRIKGRSAPYSLYANGTLAMDSIYYPYTLPLWIDTLMPFIPQDTGWQQLVVTLHEPWERRAYDTVQVYVKNCTTLTANHDYNKNMVEIFPNPATTVLHINFKTALTLPATITVYDTQGKKIKQITTKKNENIIDISKLVQGVYGIRVSGNGASVADKFVKVE